MGVLMCVMWVSVVACAIVRAREEATSKNPNEE